MANFLLFVSTGCFHLFQHISNLVWFKSDHDLMKKRMELSNKVGSTFYGKFFN